MTFTYYFKNKTTQFFVDLTALIVSGLATVFILVKLYHVLVYGVVSVLPKLFSLVLPTATLSLGVCVIFIVHPVHALLCLIAVFFNTVLLYLAAEAEFLALVFLIVYVGAIAILFLFVIRLLNVKELISVPRRKISLKDQQLAAISVPLARMFVFLTPGFLGKVLTENDIVTRSVGYSTVAAFEQYVSWGFQDINVLSQLLYTYYSYLFRLTALLLLTARLGAIILATRSVSTNNALGKLPVLAQKN